MQKVSSSRDVFKSMKTWKIDVEERERKINESKRKLKKDTIMNKRKPTRGMHAELKGKCRVSPR